VTDSLPHLGKPHEVECAERRGHSWPAAERRLAVYLPLITTQAKYVRTHEERSIGSKPKQRVAKPSITHGTGRKGAPHWIEATANTSSPLPKCPAHGRNPTGNERSRLSEPSAKGPAVWQYHTSSYRGPRTVVEKSPHLHEDADKQERSGSARVCVQLGICVDVEVLLCMLQQRRPCA
jgi:hypothetical protein